MTILNKVLNEFLDQRVYQRNPEDDKAAAGFGKAIAKAGGMELINQGENPQTKEVAQGSGSAASEAASAAGSSQSGAMGSEAGDAVKAMHPNDSPVVQPPVVEPPPQATPVTLSGIGPQASLPPQPANIDTLLGNMKNSQPVVPTVAAPMPVVPQPQTLAGVGPTANYPTIADMHKRLLGK